MSDALKEVGEALGQVASGMGQAAVALAELMEEAAWLGPCQGMRPEEDEAGQGPAPTEKG